MKKAVIVVGSHHSGKSKTIRKFFKPLAGLSANQRLFTLRDGPGAALSQSIEESRRRGAVLSQTLEERSGRGVALSQCLEERRLSQISSYLGQYADFERLVIAARPPDERLSYYSAVKAELKRCGFGVRTVHVEPGRTDTFYKARAREILHHLR